MKIGKLRVIFVLLLTLACVPAVWAQRFGPWELPVNIGATVNTVMPEGQPFISKDGLSLYFTRMEGDTVGVPQYVWVAKRSSREDNWGEPQKLGPAINPTGIQAFPLVTSDGHWMYFTSDRPSGFGKHDIWVSWRPNKHEDLPTDSSGGWQEPVNLGAGVNTKYGERSPVIFEDEETGVITLYFDSNRPGLGGRDIYASALQPNGTFGPAALVVELSSPYNDEQPMISRNGLEMYFVSDRPGSMLYPEDGLPSLDIWVSTRASTRDNWGMPQLVTELSSPYHDGRPALSFDGKTIYFFSAERTQDCLTRGQCNVSPWMDIWMSTREKLTGPKEK